MGLLLIGGHRFSLPRPREILIMNISLVLCNQIISYPHWMQEGIRTPKCHSAGDIDN